MDIIDLTSSPSLNEEGLVLLRDALVSVQTALQKVNHLKSYIRLHSSDKPHPHTSSVPNEFNPQISVHNVKTEWEPERNTIGNDPLSLEPSQSLIPQTDCNNDRNVNIDEQNFQPMLPPVPAVESQSVCGKISIRKNLFHIPEEHQKSPNDPSNHNIRSDFFTSFRFTDPSNNIDNPNMNDSFVENQNLVCNNMNHNVPEIESPSTTSAKDSTSNYLDKYIADPRLQVYFTVVNNSLSENDVIETLDKAGFKDFTVTVKNKEFHSYGFIKFSDEESSKKALQMSLNLFVGDKTIKILPYQKKGIQEMIQQIQQPRGEIEETLLINISSGYQMNREGNTIKEFVHQSSEEQENTIPSESFFFSSEPASQTPSNDDISTRLNVENQDGNSKETNKLQPSVKEKTDRICIGDFVKYPERYFNNTFEKSLSVNDHSQNDKEHLYGPRHSNRQAESDFPRRGTENSFVNENFHNTPVRYYSRHNYDRAFSYKSRNLNTTEYFIKQNKSQNSSLEEGQRNSRSPNIQKGNAKDNKTSRKNVKNNRVPGKNEKNKMPMKNTQNNLSQQKNNKSQQKNYNRQNNNKQKNLRKE